MTNINTILINYRRRQSDDRAAKALSDAAEKKFLSFRDKKQLDISVGDYIDGKIKDRFNVPSGPAVLDYLIGKECGSKNIKWSKIAKEFYSYYSSLVLGFSVARMRKAIKLHLDNSQLEELTNFIANKIKEKPLPEQTNDEPDFKPFIDTLSLRQQIAEKETELKEVDSKIAKLIAEMEAQ